LDTKTEIFNHGIADKEMLSIDCILMDVAAKSDTEVISILADKLFEKGMVKPSFKSALLEREKNFPTGLPAQGIGIAIPHADSVHILKPSFAIAKLKNAVQFFKMGGEPNETVNVSIVILMGIVDDKAQVPTIVKILDMFSDEVVVKRIQQMKTSQELYNIFHEKVGM
jgi:PTS system galactitol-specific IIA component